MLEKVIEICGIVVIIGVLMGCVAIPFFQNVNTTGWSSQNIVIWGALVLISLSVILILLFRKFLEN